MQDAGTRRFAEAIKVQRCMWKEEPPSQTWHAKLTHRHEALGLLPESGAVERGQVVAGNERPARQHQPIGQAHVARHQARIAARHRWQHAHAFLQKVGLQGSR